MSITPQTLLRFTVGAAITAVVLFLMWYFSSIVIYILVSAVLAIMGRPLVARISRGRIGRWRVPRWCGALVTLLVIWIVFAVMCGLFVPLVTNKLYQLAHLDFSTALTSVEEPLQKYSGLSHSLLLVARNPGVVQGHADLFPAVAD